MDHGVLSIEEGKGDKRRLNTC